MVFSSLLFLFRFLPAVLLVYYAAPRPLRNFVLLLVSLIFYAWGEPVYMLLMLVTILVSYTGGILVYRFQQTGKMKSANAALFISCAISLSMLVFFKYAGFVVETVNNLTGAGLGILHAALPIGISFYTFQTMSYIIDVYRGEAVIQKNLISYGTYITMFPQLIAGPIVQYKSIDKQLRMRRETAEQFAKGIHRLIIGLGKKVLIANNAGMLWETIRVSSFSEIPVMTAWLGLAAYTFQIYFDFSAYSDMAIGLGHMFGFYFPENFNYPYTSKSITEFWRRWHISLGTWFREYVYIPLGGNRVSRWKHIRNIGIVWLLTGAWHGASWNFVIWGVYYGVLLLMEKFVFNRILENLPSVFQHVYCMLFIMLGWNIFVFEDIGEGMDFLKSLFGIYGQGVLNEETVYLLYNNIFLLVICILGCTGLPSRIGKWVYEKLADKQILWMVIQNVFYIGIFMLSIAWLVDATFNPFLYFRF